MKKRGFTLVELLGVMVLLVLILLVSMPTIISQIKKTTIVINEATEALISNSIDLYIDDNLETYNLVSGDVYCIQLQDLVSQGFLFDNLKDSKGNKIDPSNYVKVNVLENSKFDISVSNTCEATSSVNYAVVSGDIGQDNWYTSDVVVRITPVSENQDVLSYKYCVTESKTCEPTTEVIGSESTDVTLSTSSKTNRICSIVTNVSGLTSNVECSNKYKIDKEPPIIMINGSTSNQTINVGIDSLFELPEAVVSDNSGEKVTVTKSGNLNLKVEGSYDITYTARDLSGNTSTLKLTVKVVMPMLQTWASYPSTDFHSSTYRSKIISATFLDSNVVPSTVSTSLKWDVSKDKDGSVMAWLIADSTDSTYYHLYIGGNGGVFANYDSGYLFHNFTSLKSIDLSALNTSRTTSMDSMFYYCRALTSLTLGENFDTSQVTNMQNMFYYCEVLPTLDTENWNVSQVNTMYQMFYECSKLTIINVSKWNTSSVTNMSSLFYGCDLINGLNVRLWNTSQVTNMGNLFKGCKALTEIDVSLWNTSQVTSMSNLFDSCSKLTTIAVDNWDTSKVTTMFYMFNGCSGLTLLNVSNFNTGQVTSFGGMFSGCSNLEVIDVSDFVTTNLKTMMSMFNGCSKVKVLDVSGFDTSNVTSMYTLFSGCKSLESVDVTNFDISKITDLHGMFSHCSSLTTLDVTTWNTSKVTDMKEMFYGCSGLTELDLSNFNTERVDDMERMFQDCKSLTELDLSNFDTSQVTTFKCMFANCTKLVILDVSSFDTSKVTDMQSVFNGCNNLEVLNVSKWDVSQVTTMSYLFGACKKLTSLDLSGWEMSKITDLQGMFYECNSLSATLNIYYNCFTYGYSTYMFNNTATVAGAQVVINYSSATSTLVNKMISYKTSNANVVKGTQASTHTITISGNDDIKSNYASAYESRQIILSSTSGNYHVTSFKVNGVEVKGNKFTMPNENVTITDIVVIDTYVVESAHNPYPQNIDTVYFEQTFEGAKSISVKLTYQTANYNNPVYIYGEVTGGTYNSYYGTTKTTETIKVYGNYIKIRFKTTSSSSSYYGFKAIIIPNY